MYACALRCFTCVPSSQTELNDGIAMIVGNNDRMQGIISQLELACSTIEVSVVGVSSLHDGPFSYTAEGPSGGP